MYDRDIPGNFRVLMELVSIEDAVINRTKEFLLFPPNFLLYTLPLG